MFTNSLRAQVLLLLVSGTVLLPLPALASWPTPIVEVRATQASIPAVASVSDGARGAIVLWHELNGEGVGQLRAAHILPSGASAPAWLADLVACREFVRRDQLGAISDGLGGAFVWWVEVDQIYLTRLGADGVVSTAWPTRGLRIGALGIRDRAPQVICPSPGQVCMAWWGYTGLAGSRRSDLVTCLDADGAFAPGWPRGAVEVGNQIDHSYTSHGLALARAADGGVWVAWGEAVAVDESSPLTISYHATRFLPNGRLAPGLGRGGATLLEAGVLRYGWLIPVLEPLAISGSEDGGLDLLTWADAGSADTESGARLWRYGSGLSLRPGWPLEGVMKGGGFSGRGSSALSPRLQPFPGGTLVAVPEFATEGYSGIAVSLPGSDPWRWGSIRGSLGGPFRCDLSPSGAAAIATSSPYTWRNGLSGDVARVDAQFMAVDGRCARYLEWYDDSQVRYYGGVAISVVDPESAVLFWAQEKQRHGLYATRLSVEVPILDVPRPPTTGLRVRFERGRGVVIQSGLAPGGDLRVAILDILGRQVASALADGGEGLLPGTQGLPAGVYMVRGTAGDRVLTARFVVVR